MRVVLVIALSTALWRSLWHDPVQSEAASLRMSAPPAEVRRVLARASVMPSVRALGVRIDAAPTRVQLAWLAALSRAGVMVHWTGELTDAALELRRLPGPRGTLRALVHGTGTQPVVLSDAAGLIDTLKSAGREVAPTLAVDVGELSGPLRARAGALTLEAAAAEAHPPRAVLDVGKAGWEGGFVTAALSEAGWPVRARFPTAPGVTVADSSLLPIDTARYAAVVVLDSTAADLGPAIARFVAAGGGVVLAGSGATIAALRPLAPASLGARQPPAFPPFADSVTSAQLATNPLVGFVSDAIALDRARSAVVMAARREGLGRVVLMGYDETWRWRMQGGENGLAQHRAWWSALASSVAMEAMPSTSAAGTYSAAPRAAIGEQLGPASPVNAPAQGVPPSRTLVILLSLLAIVALLAETASRRFRGAT